MVRNLRILLVEDDPDFRQYLTLLLENEGFRVDSVASGGEVLPRLEAEEFQLVLLDILLPDQDGCQVLEAIRQHPKGRQLPILMITADLATERVVEAFRKGASGYIVKPFDLDELLLKIQEVVE